MDLKDTSLLEQADYILASGRMKVDKNILEKATNLKMIQRTGVGLDSLDLEEIKKRNIPLYVNQGINAQSVAEHTILLILACLRNLPQINDNTKNGIWIKQKSGIQTYELKGKTVGLIGMGHIARIVASILKSFSVNILYYDVKRQDESIEKEFDLKYCEFDDLLSKSDIISLHCPLNNSTRYIINEDSISKFKKGAIFVNTARGGLVKTEALIKGLDNGIVAFAGLDVHEIEPINKDYSLLQHNKAILTPHIGGITYNSFYDMMSSAMMNIFNFEHKNFNAIEKYKMI